jgi:hypothetical protein
MKKYSALIYNLLLVLTICSQLWTYIATYLNNECGMEVLEGVFYQFNALTHFLLWVILFGTAFLKSNKWSSIFIVTGLILTFNQFADEMWFDPYQIQLNEKVLGIFLFVYYFVKYFRSNYKIEYLNEPLD